MAFSEVEWVMGEGEEQRGYEHRLTWEERGWRGTIYLDGSLFLLFTSRHSLAETFLPFPLVMICKTYWSTGG